MIVGMSLEAKDYGLVIMARVVWAKTTCTWHTESSLRVSVADIQLHSSISSNMMRKWSVER